MDKQRLWQPPASDLDLERAARTDLGLLITGRRETTLAFARLVHMLSRRRDRPFLVVECDAPETELEEILMGALVGEPRPEITASRHEAGGSLYLQDVDRLTLPFARQLADVLDDMGPSTAPRRSPWRIMASSVEHLLPRVYSGLFDVRLFYRLSALDYMLPDDDGDGPIIREAVSANDGRRAGE